MMKAIPGTEKMISKKQVENLPDLKIEKNYILLTRAGTIGNVIIADKQLESLIVSEDVLRLVPKDEESAYYVFAYLSSEIGQANIKMYTYGSVIQHIESQHILNIQVPIFEQNETSYIVENIRCYISNIEKAKELEIQAIQMIEQEIEKWNN